MAPLVSVLIPAYNAERWIAETLDSVLAQTWPNLEIIVADDGSTDETRRIAQRSPSHRVRVLELPHRGASAARNAAMDAAQGTYLQFIDADDLLAPGKVAAQVTALDGGGPLGLATGPWAPFIVRPGDAAAKPDALWRSLSPIQWMLDKFNHNAYMFPATWLAHRELASRAGPWNEALSLDDDGEFMARLVCASQGVSFVEGAYSYHRVGNVGSLSSQVSSRALRSLWQSMETCTSALLGLEDSERVRAACIQYLQDNLVHFIPDAPELNERCQALAEHLGGHLEAPRYSPQFALLRTLLGWRQAKQLRSRWNRVQLGVRRHWSQMRAYQNDTKGPAC